MHTGCQWEELPIEKDASGKPEIHHTRIFRIFQRWVKDGCFEKIFVGSQLIASLIRISLPNLTTC
jgi:transposase